MTESQLRRKIFELDFAIHELVLFLDTHPTNKKAADLLTNYKQKRNELISIFNNNFGQYILTALSVPESERFEWLKSPWPWENNFMEG